MKNRTQDFIKTQIYATREAGAVERCHTIPHHGSYNTAHHSYGAVSLLLLLHPDPSLALIKAVQWHGCAGRWLADLPSPARWDYPDIENVYQMMEARILKGLGLLQELDREDARWAQAVDMLDLWLWCREQEAMGNRATVDLRRTCQYVLGELISEKNLPEPAQAFYLKTKMLPHYRLSEFFEEAISGPK